MKIKENDFLMIRKGLKCNKHSKKLLFTLKQIIKQILWITHNAGKNAQKCKKNPVTIKICSFVLSN